MTLLYRETAAAHSRGLSQSEFVVVPGGFVEAEVVVATTESLTSIVLDKDHDGVVTADEIAASEEDLRKLVTDGIQVDGDGRPCPAELQGATLVEGDGLRITARYRCDPRARSYGVTLFFLTDLKEHRHVARISVGVGGSVSQQKLLGSTDRYLALELPPDPAPRAPRAASWRATALVALTVAFAAWMIGLWIWRYRVAKRAAKKARPGALPRGRIGG